MVFDAARGEVVLFGGSSGSSFLNDTWVWDGANWVQKSPTTSPPARAWHAMAYDAARGQVVLFGGTNSSVMFSDTWVWDGNNWMQKSPAASPRDRIDHAMAFDSAQGKVILFGGSYGAVNSLGDTWAWDGVNWTQLTPSTVPPARRGHALAAYGAGNGVLLFGGKLSSGGPPVEDSWLWNGTDWVQWSAWPRWRHGHAMAYDASTSEILLFGGQGNELFRDTWAWTGVKWLQKFPATSPSARYWHAMAHDGARRQVVMFGGTDRSSTLSDTWVWDGSSWSQRTVSGPSQRCGHAMTFDAARGEVVLFGGGAFFSPAAECDLPLNDTWAWNGSSWSRKTPATVPAPRVGHALAYDAARGQVVLFGGWGPSGYLSDTWVWDGSNWQQKFPVSSPPGRAAHSMLYDAATGRVILFGGFGSTGALRDTWVWDGTNWTQLSFPVSPQALSMQAMAYHGALGQGLLFGGQTFSGSSYFDSDETWVLDVPAVGPRPRLVTPGAGGGSSQTFVAEFEQPGGWQNLEVVNVLINFWLDGRQACYVAYVPASNSLFLVDDAGNAGGPFVGGLVLGEDNRTIANSQCAIDGAFSWVERGDERVRLGLKVNFASSFAGTKIIYLAARSSTENSGWQRLGVWKVPGGSSPPGTPLITELYPAGWTGRDRQAVEVAVTDSNGSGDLSVVNVLVNDWLDGRQACYVAYVPGLNAVFLVDDAGNAGGPFAGGVVMGTAGVASNSQCTVYGEGSWVESSGTTLRLGLSVEFRSSFQGNRVVYAAARDQVGNNSGWQAVGRRTVP